MTNNIPPATGDVSFAARMAPYQQRIHDYLDRHLPAAHTTPQRLHQAMRYAILAPGKRVRPLIVYATGETLGVAPTRLDPAAAAIEAIHAYSLVHDDLPAMDDDALRRGQPTVHIAFDEATAILVGDALQAWAFGHLATTADNTLAPAWTALLAAAAGSVGMCGGQQIDLDSADRQIPLTTLQTMHRLKTGALIRVAAEMAAAAADCAPAERDALTTWAEQVGLGFQIRDDVLDVEATTETLGKPQGSDSAQNKSTYVSLLGLDEAKRRCHQARAAALAALAPFGEAAAPLRFLADYIIRREK